MIKDGEMEMRQLVIAYRVNVRYVLRICMMIAYVKYVLLHHDLSYPPPPR
jgi:hypothetical protein